MVGRKENSPIASLFIQVLSNNYRKSIMYAVIFVVTMAIFFSLRRKMQYKGNSPFYHRIVLNNTMRLKSCLAESMGFEISTQASVTQKLEIFVVCV